MLLVALCALGLGVVAPSPNAASPGPLTVTPVTWDVIGLDSNNVNTGPNVFPVGVRACNTGSDEATNVLATWAWKTSQNAFTGPAEGAAVNVGTLAAGACRQVFFDVTLNRSPSSRLKSRDYQITVTADGGLSTAGAQRQLYVEKLVSQNRNSTKRLAGPGGCNLTYTVCDPATANVVVGKTYTYKFYAETSTAYQQLETFVNFPSSVVRVTSTSSTYSNPTGAASASIYADACGWSTVPTTRACVGPVTIPGGKAGGRIVVTYVVRAVAPGSGTLRSTIYDFSGSSYHFNSDHDSFALTSGTYTARYGVDTLIAGNGKVTSAPDGTRPDGTSGGIDCGDTGVTCSVGYATGTSVTLNAHPLGSDTFVGWSGGGCSGTSLTCTVTMSQSRSVTATFTGVTFYPLDVSKSGAGSVSADVGALACGSTCTARYGDGTLVTLTAAPSAGWTFDGWSGDGCSGTGTCTLTLSQARSVSANFSEQTYGLSVAVGGNGTVASSPGTISCGNGNTFCSEVYGSGTVVTLTASPGSGQTFTGWSGACLGTSVTCTVTMSEARAATASFSGTATYALEVGVGGSGTGTVTANVGGINCGATCSAFYSDGTHVTLTATAGSGSNFVGWSGDCSGASTTCVVTMSAARNTFASFGVPQTLTVAKAGSGSGTVTSNVGGINCGATCSASIAEGTTVTLTPTPSAGSTFTGWSGDCSGTGACTVTMSAARGVTATFTTSYALSVTRNGSGTGSVASEPAGITCGVTCSASYASGTVVTLTAAAGAGSRFSGWSGSGCSGTDACTVTMSAARSVTATFVALHALTVANAGSGPGTIASAPSGVSCGATCSAEFDAGTSVTLTATPGAGTRFAGWSGSGCTDTGTCTVTMSAERSVTATFVAVHPLSVSMAGSGAGAVSGGAIDCGSTCAADIDEGTEVTLTVTAAPGSRFAGWSGAGCSATSTCTVTMSAARSVTATFVLQHTLTVTRAGSGSGTVASAPSGVSCGSTCASDYDDGAEVTLTAAAAAGSRFAGWAGAECSGTGTCTVTMSAARSVSAAFVPLHALSIAKAGSGSGDVAGAGIDCGSTCAADYDEDTEVTLLATASTGSRFAGWSGAGCSGSGAGTCTVTMTAARSVTATFVAVHPLAVAKSGSGDGTVAGDGIDCGAACSAEYDEGSEIRLTATPAAGSRFTGWSGAGCSGTGACTVTMAAARAVTAGFVTVHPLSVTRSGSGTGAVTGDGIDCGSTCGAEYVEGTIVTLTATAAPGSRFAGWTGAGCAGTGTCTLSFGGARAVTAEFVALHSLSVTKIGSGAGTVTSDVGSLLCGPTCSADYDDGTSVTLTAVPAAGSRFAGWSGAGCAGTGTCTVTLGAARSVTAELVALHTLTLTKTGSGSGTVAGSGLDCGPTCAATFDEGTVLTLTATAAAGSSFTGWSGAGCSGTGICTVTMNTARTVGAEFTVDAAPPPPARHALTVTKGGSGDGLVAGLGTDCGATCASTFDDGAVVVLHAKAARGSRFGGWSGEDCSGTETCTVAMTAARHVTATFVRLVPLRVSVRGRGRVAATTPGIDCAPSCSATYDANELVTLVARPRPGHWLAAWSGDCAGRAERCTVTLDQARRVRARFAPNLELALATTARLVYHLPYERARVEARATWQGRPVSGAAVRVSILCRGRHLVRVLRTDRHGRAAFRWGTVLPNRARVLRCAVDARVAVNGRTANADRRSVGFIHPLWLEVTRWKGRSPVVRIWGRPGEAVVLLRNGDIVAETRIGSRGWIDVSSPRIRRGDGLHARGENHHHSHVIGA